LNTMDHPALSDASSSLAASRTRRRMRLRLTALPSALGVVKPRARRFCKSGFGKAGLSSGCGSARQKAANSGHEYRVPWSYTFRKSLDLSSRTLLGKPDLDSPGSFGLAETGAADMHSFVIRTTSPS